MAVACDGDLFAVVYRPVGKRGQRVEESAAKWCQVVLDARWDGRIHRAGGQSVTFQRAQRAGEHPLADAFDGPVQFVEAMRSAAQQDQDQSGRTTTSR
jgi:hypothetical protein